MQWGDRWKWPGGRGPVEVMHDECGQDVTVEVRCEHCERELALAGLRARAPRGVTEAPSGNMPGQLSAARLTSSADGVRLAEEPG